MTLRVLSTKNLKGRHFVRGSSVEICLVFFLMIRLRLSLGEKDSRKVPFSCHDIMDTYCQPELSLLIVALIS